MCKRSEHCTVETAAEQDPYDVLRGHAFFHGGDKRLCDVFLSVLGCSGKTQQGRGLEACIWPGDEGIAGFLKVYLVYPASG